MQTVLTPAFSQQEIKKSNFLTYLVPFNEFDLIHEQLKLDHPKAVHIVWAYRYLNKYHQIVENQSDDGEPRGTSGPPALNSLRGASLINVGVFIVRYFGGIKLGTGGLVRAYSSSVNLAINEANLVNFEIKDIVKLSIPFTLVGRFEHYFDKENIKIQKEFDAFGMIAEILLNQDEFKEFYSFYEPFLIDGVKILAMPLFAKDIACD
ncbi:IMPACT family protein [Campylobacter corcagiensis]|uniref:YigZ family protein n=1 Tax=Campylobacter corcagiensis TaxID=1448857 RepID=A0A7M1LGT5_9BACT|nr:YigZ family protein [Campylobacter corcagiensis]QKF65152.1 putative translation regulator, IMPACT family (UPF0029 domain) [Campylobacter corcagiensis]QOQ86705.1 YigZ family protein [Campylobacter corcagiensis]